MTALRLALPLLLVPLSACSASMLGLPSGRVVAYQPQVVELEVKTAVVFRAMREFVVENKLNIVYEDANLGRIEAVGAVDSSFGMVTRERWVLQIDPGTLTIDAQLQKRGRGGIWRSPESVSSRYTYTRESLAHDAIRERTVMVEVRTLAGQ